jgi:hypothetical protein
MSRSIPPLPNTPSWRGAQLRHGDNLTFTLHLIIIIIIIIIIQLCGHRPGKINNLTLEIKRFGNEE